MGRKRNRPHNPSGHHRRSRFLGGDNSEENISIVTDVKHRAWHILFSGERTIDSIADELNDVWIDPRYKLVVERR